MKGRIIPVSVYTIKHPGEWTKHPNSSLNSVMDVGDSNSRYQEKKGWVTSGPGWTLQRREQPLAFAGNRNKRNG
jgi:hypothetical protein